MSIYHSREIDIELADHGNKVKAIMHWFDGDGIWPYDEWEEVVELSDIKMLSEKNIEEMVKEKLKKTVEREFDVDKLFFKWKVK